MKSEAAGFGGCVMGYLPRKLNHQGNGLQLERKRPSSTLHCWRMAGCYASMTLPGQAWAPRWKSPEAKRSLQLCQSFVQQRDAKDTQPALSVQRADWHSPTGPGPAALRIRPLALTAALKASL